MSRTDPRASDQMTTQLSTGLEKVLAEVNQQDSNLSNYSIDDSTPKAVVEPRNEGELSAILRIADKYVLKVIAIGGGNDIGLGNIPSGLDLVVLTRSLSKIVHYVPEDLTISVQCGVTLEKAQEELSKKRQFIPINHAGSNPTFGGIIASNSNTPPFSGYGTIRDLLLGVRVVNPGGSITKAGSNVVKNVAGYDLSKIYIGSLGTLGLILEANLKISPLPDHESTIMIFSNSLLDLGKIALEVNARLFPRAIELVNKHLLDSFGRNVESSFQNFGYCLMVMHRGNSTSVSRESRDIEGMAMKYPTVKSDSFIDSESVHLWSAFRSILGGRRVIRFRISVPPADTSSSIIETENEFEYFKPKIFADPERGVVYTSIMVGQDSYLLTERLKHLRKFAEDTSGNLVLESAPTSIKREMDVWGSLPSGFEIMRQLKEKFDPNHVLSPGRYVGGI